MLSVVMFRARRVMLTMGLMVTFLGNESASPNTLNVQDPRPVAKAILELKYRYNSTLVTKGGSLTFKRPSADPDELGAVEALLKSYNESHRGFVFAVLQGGRPASRRAAESNGVIRKL